MNRVEVGSGHRHVARHPGGGGTEGHGLKKAKVCVGETGARRGGPGRGHGHRARSGHQGIRRGQEGKGRWVSGRERGGREGCGEGRTLAHGEGRASRRADAPH